MTEATAPQPSEEALRGIADASKSLLKSVGAQATAEHAQRRALADPSVGSDERWQIAKAFRDTQAATAKAVEVLVKAHLRAINDVQSA